MINYIYFKLYSGLLCSLFFTNFIFTAAAPNENHTFKDNIFFILSLIKYHNLISKKYHLHAKISNISTEKEYIEFVSLLDSGISICESDTSRGNTPFHFLGTCCLSVDTLKEAYVGVRTTQNDYISRCEKQSRFMNLCSLKPLIIMALCDKLEKRALQKATMLGKNIPIINLDGAETNIELSKFRRFFNGFLMPISGKIEESVLELPDDAFNIILIDLEFDDLMAFRLVCKKAYLLAMHTTSRVIQKKYGLDILHKKNKAGKTALDIVKNSLNEDEIKKNNKELIDINSGTDFTINISLNELDMTPIFDRNLMIFKAAEFFLIQQMVATNLKRLEDKYSSMPGNIIHVESEKNAQAIQPKSWLPKFFKK